MAAGSLDYGTRRNAIVYWGCWEGALLLCMILRFTANSAWVCVPDADFGRDGLPVLSDISLETARGIRVSSSGTRRVTAPLRKLYRVRAPASLNDVPRLDRAALGKYNARQAICSVLRSDAKQEKPTDCRDTHSERDDWIHLCPEEFRGTALSL